MSTNSYIGYLLPNGDVRSIYCHSDGYISHNGLILVENYQAARDIAQMVELGDMSCLRHNIHPTPSMPHSRANRQPVVSLYYSRDLREDGYETSGHEPENYGLEECIECLEGDDHFYLWTGKEWLVWNDEIVCFPVKELLDQ